MNIYPTILTDSLAELEQQLEISKKISQVEIVQIDMIDGYFADNLTVTPLDLATLDFWDLKCDLHLMVDEPMDFVLEAEEVKRKLPIRSVIAQIEHMSSQSAFIEEVKAQQWVPGLSLDINTPFESIDPTSWDQISIVQLMGNVAGKQGQVLDERIFTKIKDLSRQLKSMNQNQIEIIIDIGVKVENVARLAAAGAKGVAVGSLIWQSAYPQQVVDELLARVS